MSTLCWMYNSEYLDIWAALFNCYTFYHSFLRNQIYLCVYICIYKHTYVHIWNVMTQIDMQIKIKMFLKYFLPNIIKRYWKIDWSHCMLKCIFAFACIIQIKTIPEFIESQSLFHGSFYSDGPLPLQWIQQKKKRSISFIEIIKIDKKVGDFFGNFGGFGIFCYWWW